MSETVTKFPFKTSRETKGAFPAKNFHKSQGKQEPSSLIGRERQRGRERPRDVFDGEAIFEAGPDERIRDPLVELLEYLGEGPADSGGGYCGVVVLLLGSLGLRVSVAARRRRRLGRERAGTSSKSKGKDGFRGRGGAE